MIERAQVLPLLNRIVNLRTETLRTRPFFGRLLLHLKIGFAECGTAYTDMKQIVFDPSFAGPMSDDELWFLMMHELMHCVLHHCTRGEGLDPLLYNIACDIVVNSLIEETLGVTDFIVAGQPAMHLAPNKKEGRVYTAEQVYEMLQKASPKTLQQMYGLPTPPKKGEGDGEDGSQEGEGDGSGNEKNGNKSGKKKGGKSGKEDKGQNGPGSFDSHDGWGELKGTTADDEWEQHIRESAAAGGGGFSGNGTGIPASMERYLKEISHEPKTNWRQLLHDFIQHDRYDYTFCHPDKRFQDGFIMPSFELDDEGDSVEKLWFLVDTSGSISEMALSEALHEIRGSMDQIGNVSGKLSFFDTEVSEPEPFENEEDLKKIKPVGGGGTSFDAIFEAMDRYFRDELPAAVIILTDGCAPSPEEKAAHEVPVMWIIINSPQTPPWGEVVHIQVDEKEET